MTPSVAPATPYGTGFYDDQAEGSLSSARVVLPRLWELLQPQRVVDFGCGVGPWLKAATELGATEILGLDGPHVPLDRLAIPHERFRPTDLSQPVQLDDEFDLAISVEVAEHLPESRAASFVADLTRAAPVVLFAAAVPKQGGTNHVNEQWPDYWAALFARHGFAAYDPFRLPLWNDERVEWWYRQNLLLFASRAASLSAPESRDVVRLVHPARLERDDAPAPVPGIREAATVLGHAVRRSVGVRLGKQPRAR